ncbi:MAG: peroxiredoxin [Actinomycetota bacterium]|nr:peroxiredoxin [Actinomycetota bacterium]MDG2120107.1 peroxiredoxin [Actinomycetota bacterium]
MLSKGDRAPAFTLLDQRSQKVSLNKQAPKSVFLFFYPKAGTSGCTSQALGLRDSIKGNRSIQLIGVSPDLPKIQMKWDNKHELRFPLLADPDHKVSTKYGVWGPKKLYGKEYEGVMRSVFWISNTGRILECWYKISPKVSVEKLNEVLERSNG